MLPYMTSENYEEKINEVLRILGEFFRVDRVYIFKYDFDKNECSNTFEYCRRSIAPQIDSLQNVSLNGMDQWICNHLDGKEMYIPDVAKLEKDSELREGLDHHEIKSLIALPMLSDEGLYGFLGFDSVINKRKFTALEREVLRIFANMLVSAIKRVELQHNLEESQLRIANITEVNKIALWEMNVEARTMKYSRNWAELIGYDPEEIDNSMVGWKKYIDEKYVERASSRLQALIDGELDNDSLEIKYIHKDGHPIWMRASGSVHERKTGKATTIFGFRIDVTKAKEQEKMLEIINKAVKYSPAAVVLTNEKAEIEFVNAEFSKITGYSFEEVVGKNPRMLKSGNHDQDFYDDLWGKISRGENWKGVFHNRRKDGELYWESSMIAPIQNEDKEISHYIAIKSDITKVKQMEEALEQRRISLEKEIQEKTNEVEDAQKSSIIALAKLTEARDVETGKHVERVQYLCRVLGKSLRNQVKYNDVIDDEYLEDIFFASALHDLGKINIPDNILLKPGKLENDEYERIKTHVDIGADFLAKMVRENPQRRIIMAQRIAKYHHERWDGSGYLQGLQGTDIPLAARIMALVDVYDALRSKRPYKATMTHRDVMEVIIEEAGKHFDPDVVNAFVKAEQKFEVIYDSFAG